MFWSKTDALELIELTYALVDEKDGYQNLFDKIGGLFGDAMFGLQMWDDLIEVDSDQIITSGWDVNAVAAYAAYYSSTNLYLPEIGKLGSGNVRQLKDIVPVETSSKSEFLNDFLYVNGNYSGVTATILNEDGRYGALSIDGPVHTQQHWDELEALVNVLAPHLKRVMHLSRQLQEVSLYQSITDHSMERIAAGMLVVNAEARLEFSNSNALDILSECKVLKTGMGGLLTASTVSQTRELRRLIASAASGDMTVAAASGGFMMLEARNGKKMMAMVAPLHRGLQKRAGLVKTWSSQKNFAAIFLSDPDSHVRPPPELLRIQYNLTKTEAELALHLHAGGTLSGYCDIRFVTINTARTQLKSIFHKTGVMHQGGLVALLNRMTALGQETKLTQS